MINRFILNEVSYFGPGAREVLQKETSRLGAAQSICRNRQRFDKIWSS